MDSGTYQKWIEDIDALSRLNGRRFRGSWPVDRRRPK